MPLWWLVVALVGFDCVYVTLDTALNGMFARRRTVVIIAHRLSTVRDIADRIVVVQDGTIVEEGSHRELMHRGCWYAKMTRLQGDGAEEYLASAAQSAW